MTADFLPEFHYAPWDGGYVGTYKLYEDKYFRQIPGRVIYPTSGQAKDAARAYLSKWLNPKIESERIEQAVELSEFDAWKRKKAADEQAERAKVFGNVPRQTVRDFAGNEVKVELRRRVKA